MSETVPASLSSLVPGLVEKPPSKRRGKKPGLAAARKSRGFSVSKLIPEALSMSQERAGMSLAALKKALAAAGYDVEKNNSRIKLALKRLVNNGVLVQTKGTGASGSFKLSKKAAPENAKGKVKKSASAKAKKLGLSRASRSSKSSKTKVVKKPKATPTKASGSRPKTKGTKGVQQRKSPAKARAANPNAGKPKMVLQKNDLRKAAAKK
ncbi:histone H1t [Phodopus roborovskii]|uniref:H1f6 protein n=1 Tax=Phodopus roborovskii TaxID=109678 RepID=A0AAU9ZR81_PHORO|nr:histone H1t [Phodopus roborovskii]CAH6806664.1 H1f6 [Phodopus roborovskii]